MKHEKSCLVFSGTTTIARGFVWLARWVFKSLKAFSWLWIHTQEESVMESFKDPCGDLLGVWAACHQQAKKGL